LQYFHVSGPLSAGSVDFIAASFAIVVTLYFWWQNTKGRWPSPAKKPCHIMKLVTVMVVLLIAWSLTQWLCAIPHCFPAHPRNLG